MHFKHSIIYINRKTNYLKDMFKWGMNEINNLISEKHKLHVTFKNIYMNVQYLKDDFDICWKFLMLLIIKNTFFFK